jgi:magnesium transporter
VVVGPENDIDETEDQLFNDDTAVSRRSYELSREVVEMQRTAHALVDIVRSLQEGFDKYDVDVELQRNLRDVQPHRGRAGAE